MSEKERLWKEALSHRLVKGKVGSSAYKLTSTTKIEKLLTQYELERMKPHVETVKTPEVVPINTQIQIENTQLLDKLDKREQQIRALTAENSMLTQKLDRVYNELANKEKVINREGMLGMIIPDQNKSNGPMVLVEVSKTCHTYGYDGHAYISGQKLKVPRASLPTTDLILLEDAKEQ